MGVKYAKILKQYDERISIKQSKRLFSFVIFVFFVQTLHMTLLFVYFMVQETFFSQERTEIDELTGGEKFMIVIHETGQIIQLFSPLVVGLFMLFVIKYFSMSSSNMGAAMDDSESNSDYFRSSVTNSNVNYQEIAGSNQQYQERLLGANGQQ